MNGSLHLISRTGFLSCQSLEYSISYCQTSMFLEPRQEKGLNTSLPAHPNSVLNREEIEGEVCLV